MSEKINLFAEYLNLTEEVIWSFETTQHTRKERSSKIQFHMGCFVVLIIIVALPFIFASMFQGMLKDMLWVVGVLLAILGFIITLLYALEGWLSKASPVRAYAITTERLLCWGPNEVWAVNLEALKQVSLSAGIEAEDTLEFILHNRSRAQCLDTSEVEERFLGYVTRDSFASWPEIPNAAEVKAVIEDAREKRLKAIKP